MMRSEVSKPFSLRSLFALLVVVCVLALFAAPARAQCSGGRCVAPVVLQPQYAPAAVQVVVPYQPAAVVAKVQTQVYTPPLLIVQPTVAAVEVNAYSPPAVVFQQQHAPPVLRVEVQQQHHQHAQESRVEKLKIKRRSK